MSMDVTEQIQSMMLNAAVHALLRLAMLYSVNKTNGTHGFRKLRYFWSRPVTLQSATGFGLVIKQVDLTHCFSQ